jgi:hypothetical protein
LGEGLARRRVLFGDLGGEVREADGEAGAPAAGNKARKERCAKWRPQRAEGHSSGVSAKCYFPEGPSANPEVRGRL